VHVEYGPYTCSLRVRLLGVGSGHPVWDSHNTPRDCRLVSGILYMLRIPAGATEDLAQRVVPLDSIRADSVPPGRYRVQVTLPRPTREGEASEPVQLVQLDAGAVVLP
jgi:hypothetical protein